MWIPILLQQSPADDFWQGLIKLLPVLIFLGAALLPALKQSRDRQAKKEATRRSLERTWEEAQAEMERAPKPAPKPPPKPGDLEERVRRYFQDVAQAPPAAKAARPPARFPPPAPKPRTRHQLVHIDHLESGAERGRAGYRQRERKPQGAAPALTSKRGRAAPRSWRAAKRAPKPLLRRMLASRSALRQAIVLREILGPPKGLEK